jgi:FkbM family methyltransferase
MVTPLVINDKKYSLNHSLDFPVQAQIQELARRRWYENPMPEVGVVIDAGANIGSYSLYMSAFAKKVYAIEPLTKNYEYLATNVIDNRASNIKPYKLALAGTPGRRHMYTSYNKADISAYSLLPVGELAEIVETKTLAQFMKDEKIELVHILKMDIEGLEQEVLSADDFHDIAPNILSIVGEYHIQCRNLQEVLEWHGYDYSVNGQGIFTAVRKVIPEKVDILLPHGKVI